MSASDFPLLAKVRDAARRLRGAWLSLPCVLGALAGPVAAEDPPFVPTLTKVMTYSDIIGSGGTFGGDVSINAYGKWIAASPKGVFISTGTANTTWQQVFAGGSDPMVNANTSTILCRISDSGSWVVLSRAGLYRSSDANPMEGVLVNANTGTNNVYDLDMRPNGNWIASASTGTWRLMNGAVGQILSPSSNGNGAASARRIVRINSNGDWIIMTSNGVYKNGMAHLANIAGGNIAGNVNYWSLDFNESSDWVMINSKGTFLNSVRIAAPVIEVFDIGEMEVQITNRNQSGNFTWMAISPSGIYRDAILLSSPGFTPNKTQYTLDMNNNGNWVAASEGSALLNGAYITRTGTSIMIQLNNSIDNELLCRINDFDDYVCLANNGVFRNSRSLLSVELALGTSAMTPSSSKHVLKLGANGALAALLENLNSTTTTGVYTGTNVLEPVPPAPAAVTLNGFALSWSSSGGSTVGFKVAVSQPEGPAGGTELYSGSAETFTVTDFSRFGYGMNHLTLRAVNASGGVSEPVVIEYQTAPFQVLAHALDFPAKTATLTWNSLPGKSYTIQKSTALQSWEPLELAGTGEPPATVVTAAPGQWTMTHTALDPLLNTPQQPKAFLQVKATP